MECACRWFIVDDVDMLEDDLQLLKSLFEAEGEGLSKPQIEELCAPLAGLLVTMQLDTGILMSNFKQVPASCGLPMWSPAEKALTGMSSRAHSLHSRMSKLGLHVLQTVQGLPEASDASVKDSISGRKHAHICCSVGSCRVELLSGACRQRPKAGVRTLSSTRWGRPTTPRP